MSRLLICRKGGFSLIEVLIGIIFLAIGLLTIAGMQAASVRGNFSSNNVTQATYFAKDGLEVLKNLPFTDLTAGSHPDGSKQNTADGYQSIVYNRTYVVTIITPNRKTIDYTVSWNDGVDHSISFSTVRVQ